MPSTCVRCGDASGLPSAICLAMPKSDTCAQQGARARVGAAQKEAGKTVHNPATVVPLPIELPKILEIGIPVWSAPVVEALGILCYAIRILEP